MPRMCKSSTMSVVIASAAADIRSRWSEGLQAFALCEVAGSEALDQLMRTLRPAVLVLDLALPGLGRVEGLTRLGRLSPATRMFALSDTPSQLEAISVFKA